MVKFSRVDLAVDDIGCNYYSCDDIVCLIENGQLVSKIKQYDNRVPRTIREGKKLGHTVYLGSNKSDIKLRIYDKRLEQLEKHKEDCGHEWIRWELELKDSRADLAVKKLIKNKKLSHVCVGILGNYCRFIIPDNKNRSRCSTEPVWSAFIDSMERMSVYMPSDPKTIDDTKRWIDENVGASISAVIESDGGSLDFFYNNLQKWKIKRENNRELNARLARSQRIKDFFEKR